MLSIGKFCATIFILLIILTSLAAIGIYSSYTAKPGPKLIRNQFIGLWLSVQLLFFSLQSLYLSYKDAQRYLKPFVFADLVYFTLAITLSSLCALFHVLVNRIDSCLFASLILLVNLLNFLIIINRRFETQSQNKHMDYIDFIKTSSFITLKDGLIKKLFRLFNFLLKIFFLILLILITNGALMNNLAQIKFGPRGVLVSVPLEDKTNRSIKIHVFCDGPKNDNHSSFLIEGDFRTSHVDFLDVQRQLVKMDRRVCIWDKAGLGYSDYLYSDMSKHELYYPNFLKIINESKVVFVGVGDGAHLVLKNAAHIQNLERVVLIDAFPTRLKWNAEYSARNGSHTKLHEHMQKLMDRKFFLFSLVNGFGVPFGIVPAILQMKNFDFSREKNLLLMNEKIWLSEKMNFEKWNDQNNDDKYELSSFNISHVITVKTNDQIYEQVCVPKKQSTNSKYCLYEKQINKYLINERKKILNNGRVYECNRNDCGIEFFLQDSLFTANALISLT